MTHSRASASTRVNRSAVSVLTSPVSTRPSSSATIVGRYPSTIWRDGSRTDSIRCSRAYLPPMFDRSGPTSAPEPRTRWQRLHAAPFASPKTARPRAASPRFAIAYRS